MKVFVSLTSAACACIHVYGPSHAKLLVNLIIRVTLLFEPLQYILLSYC